MAKLPFRSSARLESKEVKLWRESMVLCWLSVMMVVLWCRESRIRVTGKDASSLIKVKG